MAAALILPGDGGRLSAAASKSGLGLSPGRLAAGGVRAAFKGRPPSDRAARQIGEASTAPGLRWEPASPLSALEQNAACAPTPLGGKAVIWQPAGGPPAGVQGQRGFGVLGFL